jgi:AcrR family transcriptional regulator
VPAKGHRTKAGDRTRAAILDSAIRLLGRAGPDGFSASAVANEAGVSKATVFHHFRSIEEIPLLALDRFWASSLSRDSSEFASARAWLLELGNQLVSLTGRRRTLLRAHFVFLMKAMFDSKLQRLLTSMSAQMHKLTVKELSRRLPGRVSEKEIETATHMLEMVLDGMLIGLAVNHNPRAVEITRRAWRRFLDLLLREIEGS